MGKPIPTTNLEQLQAAHAAKISAQKAFNEAAIAYTASIATAKKGDVVKGLKSPYANRRLLVLEVGTCVSKFNPEILDVWAGYRCCLLSGSGEPIYTKTYNLVDGDFKHIEGGAK